MKDRLGRVIDYARISVTDKCNLRCRYCMPSDIEHVDMKHILTFEETVLIAGCMAELGISKIKLTGGEPLIRRGICDLVRMLKNTDKIEQVTITTNGILLEKYLPQLVEAGIDGINVSIDSPDPDRYRSITGSDELAGVLKGMQAAVEAGLKVKINSVTFCGMEDAAGLIDLAKQYGVDVRFIELMPIGFAKGYRAIRHDELLRWFIDNYPDAIPCASDGNGPAKYYSVPGFRGRIGFISALSDSFCDSCNRVRLTTRGFLKSCLCYNSGVDLMPIIRSDMADDRKHEELCEAITKAIMDKPAGHDFAHTENVSEELPMSAIGG